ncbi:hypothetical protein [Streptomyces sp. N35]|uniref:hypothetical protein n=1 Tax=Streptomyces sp. N35 TaxID=2795730 RepID=UPI0018F2F375|nr:hypothetical protein [Streptomyces sp. N35]
MNDQDPEERLAKHKSVAAWLEYQLQQEIRIIAALEREVAEHERRKKVAHRELRFVVERSWTEETPDAMHRGNCRKNRSGGELIEGQEAALIMRDRSDHIIACATCNPLPALKAVYLTPHTPDEGA